MRGRKAAVLTAVAATAALIGAGGPAAAQRGEPETVKVLTEGLSGPFGLQTVGHRGFIVAEGDSGEVTRVDENGRQRTIVDAPGVSGVAAGYGKVFAVLGGGDETGEAPAGPYAPSSVLRTDYRGRHVKVIADLAKYELDHNPDGQVQFGPDGKPYDALSNPFSMDLSKYGLLVADGGANDVLKVNRRTGKVSTFFVPPTVKTAACLAEGAQANPGTVGCDPVPTGIAVANGSVYVSTLGAEVPGAGRVYRLDGRTGKVQHVYRGLTAPTGVAVTPWGTIYVSEVLYGAPEGDGPPPAGFDPATVGRITKLSNGTRTHAQVTMPTGIEFKDGRLYSTTWSIASFLGIQDAGQIVKVNPRAFS